MKLKRNWIFGVLSLGLTLSASQLGVAGGFEKPIMIGGRALGMGGTAVGYDPSLSSLVNNPAHFRLVKNWKLGGDFAPLISKSTLDLSKGSLGLSDSVDSEWRSKILFNAAGVIRLSDVILFALGVHTPAFLRVDFDETGSLVDLAIDFKTYEASPTLVIQPTETFAFAIQIRILYGHYDAVFKKRIAGIERIVFDHQDLDEFKFIGGRVALSQEILPNWHLGFQVRTEALFTLEGKTDFFDVATNTLHPGIESKLNQLSYPWAFLWGLAYVADKRALVVALDVGYHQYQRIKDLDFRLKLNGFEKRFRQDSFFHNSFLIRIGTEIRLAQSVFIRFGGGYVAHVTSRQFDHPFFSPPGVEAHAGAGIGVKGSFWIIDFGYDFTYSNAPGRFQDPNFGDGSTKQDHRQMTHAICVSFAIGEA